MGIKDRRTKILLTDLLLPADNRSFLHLSSDICIVFDIVWNRKTILTVESLLSEGLLEQDPSSATPSYRLTETGHSIGFLSFPSFRYSVEKWDGLFRILSYEIPESKRELRDRLRREVASWGLGPWHRSFWVTPHPIIPALRKLVAQKEEEQFVQAFESTHVFGDRTELIQKVWNTPELESAYRTLFKTWHQILSRDMDKLEKMKLVISAYVDILKEDPGLPQQLVGESWIGFEGLTLFREIRSILLPQSP